MESTELTEEQFKLIKIFCMNANLGIVCLHALESDPPATKAKYEANKSNMLALEKAGFIKNFNEHCTDALEYAKKTNSRSFDTYVITQEAFYMFSAPEGSIN